MNQTFYISLIFFSLQIFSAQMPFPDEHCMTYHQLRCAARGEPIDADFCQLLTAIKDPQALAAILCCNNNHGKTIIEDARDFNSKMFVDICCMREIFLEDQEEMFQRSFADTLLHLVKFLDIESEDQSYWKKMTQAIELWTTNDFTQVCAASKALTAKLENGKLGSSYHFSTIQTFFLDKILACHQCPEVAGEQVVTALVIETDNSGEEASAERNVRKDKAAKRKAIDENICHSCLINKNDIKIHKGDNIPYCNACFLRKYNGGEGRTCECGFIRYQGQIEKIKPCPKSSCRGHLHSNQVNCQACYKQANNNKRQKR